MNFTTSLGEMENVSDLISWLQTTLVFQGLDRAQLAPILQIAQVQTLSKGKMIFEQGETATGFFIVKTGRVKVFQVSPTGKEQILNIFEAGENFAEVVALDGKPFPASAAAMEATEVIFFPRLAFLDMLQQHPDIAINMLISLTRHLRHLTGVIEKLSFKDVPQRLAAYLLYLSDVHVRQVPEFADPISDLAAVPESSMVSDADAIAPDPLNTVTLNLTKSQLAATLGTVPATLSRAFYRLSGEGIIAVNGSQIEILDRDRLQELSQLNPSEESSSEGSS